MFIGYMTLFIFIAVVAQKDLCVKCTQVRAERAGSPRTASITPPTAEVEELPEWIREEWEITSRGLICNITDLFWALSSTLP